MSAPTQPVLLSTARLTLRELREEDLADLRVLDTDPEVTRYMSNDGDDEAASRESLARGIRGAHEVPRSVFDLAILRTGEDRVIGRLGLHVVRPKHGDGMVWFALRKDEWRKGYGSEAFRALLGFGFGTLELHRMWGDADPRNEASWGLMARVGMRREAHLRENWWLKGERCDSYVYAILAHEFDPRDSGRGPA